MDEDPLVAIDHGFLKLDGTENDDDDDDEATQNKLLILVAKDGSERTRHVMVGVLMRQLGYRRAILQSD